MNLGKGKGSFYVSKKISRAFMTMLRYDIISWQFVTAASFVFLALFFSRDVMSHEASALSLFVFPIQWNNALGLVALAAGLCSASSFARDISSKFFRMQVVRIGKQAYLAARVLSSAFSTGMAVAVAFLVFGIYCCSVSSELISSAELASSYSYGSFESVIFSGNPIIWMGLVCLIEFAFGFTLGAIGTACTVFMAGKYTGYAGAFLVVFFWHQICTNINIPSWMDPLLLGRVNAIDDSSLSSFFGYVAAYAVISAFAIFVFAYRARKTMVNE